MSEYLKELAARNAGATHRDSRNPDRFYRKTRSGADRADYDEKTRRLELWTSHGQYVPESAEVL